MNNKKSSRIPGFFKLNSNEKLKIVQEFTDLTDKELEIIKKGFLDSDTRDKMSENVIGTYSLPYSIAVNFLINDRDYLVPMVTEEPSVVAAACYGAKLLRDNGGIKAESLENLMIGQIYLTDISSIEKASQDILKNKKEIIELGNSRKSDLLSLGGGVRDLEIKVFKNTNIGDFLRIHLFIDTKDAMGANTINTIVEVVAPLLEKITDSKALLKIVSNLADKRLAKAKGIVKKESLITKDFKGEEVIENIVKAQAIAENDIYRAVTNNKGILNGMGAVTLATGNDWRALEAGAHGYAASSERYMPLVKWNKDENNDLVGEIIVPIAVGVVGGVIQSHPVSKLSLKILNIKTASELACVIASVGLSQNLAALRALVSEGIQEGHMRLHAKLMEKDD
ncbi:MAG: hydroxymethylglutaryl-CoA reductase, degradative [Patescibacteria group bacterium]|nr:hydroxymethylglutaryl-CoA reductase, degradative [Patescibacteria group bacterium]